MPEIHKFFDEIDSRTLVVYCNNDSLPELFLRSKDFISFTNFNNFMICFSDYDKDQFIHFFEHYQVNKIFLVAQLQHRDSDFLTEGLTKINFQNGTGKSDDQIQTERKGGELILQLRNRMNEIREIMDYRLPDCEAELCSFILDDRHRYFHHVDSLKVSKNSDN